VLESAHYRIYAGSQRNKDDQLLEHSVDDELALCQSLDHRSGTHTQEPDAQRYVPCAGVSH
jgi:hypothetical protein